MDVREPPNVFACGVWVVSCVMACVRSTTFGTCKMCSCRAWRVCTPPNPKPMLHPIDLLTKPIPRGCRTLAERKKWVCVHEHHTSANHACMVTPGCNAGNRGCPANQMGCGARSCGVWDSGVSACEKWCAWWVTARTCASWRARRRSSEQHEKGLIARIFTCTAQD